MPKGEVGLLEFGEALQLVRAGGLKIPISISKWNVFQECTPPYVQSDLYKEGKQLQYNTYVR